MPNLVSNVYVDTDDNGDNDDDDDQLTKRQP